MVDKQELNEKYLELQILEYQLRQINQQMVNLDNQVLELQRLEDNLGDLTKTSPNTELLVALGGGVFSKAELKDNKTVLMNVGSNIVVEKDIPSSKEVISRQIEQIKNITKQMEQEFQVLAMKSQMLQQDLQKISSEMKEKPQ